MRNIIIAPGEHYHIFNRGNNKQDIFLDDRDRARFLFLILYFQSPLLFYNLSRPISYFVRHSVFNISNTFNIGKEDVREVVQNRYVELINFALMPNHFHLTIEEVEEHGTARYMHRVLNAYTKYFNIKYKKSGHVFQGPYKAVHISHDRQLLYLSAYIHQNAKELQKWHSKTEQYPWSSFQDYAGENRWGALLQYDSVRSRFSNGKEYKDFVITSGAKEIKRYISEEHFFL